MPIQRKSESDRERAGEMSCLLSPPRSIVQTNPRAPPFSPGQARTHAINAAVCVYGNAAGRYKAGVGRKLVEGIKLGSAEVAGADKKFFRSDFP